MRAAGAAGNYGHARGAEAGKGEAAPDGPHVAGRDHHELHHAGRCGAVGPGRPAPDPSRHFCHARPPGPPRHRRPAVEGLPQLLCGMPLTLLLT